MGEPVGKVGKPTARPFLAATAGFVSGADTPRAFLERCLAALSESESEIGAFVHLSIDGAREAADRATERWRAGRPLSRIDGIPVGIKDIIETADMPTEMGSPLFAGWRSDRDAASAAALREAGAVVLGKTVTTEFAATEPRGTRNPWDLRRTPGGSSSGSGLAGMRLSTGRSGSSSLPRRSDLKSSKSRLRSSTASGPTTTSAFPGSTSRLTTAPLARSPCSSRRR